MPTTEVKGEPPLICIGQHAHHNISFIWLTGGLKPDHKTISEFRRRNKKALKEVIKQCAKMCLKLGLIEGNTLFVDGTKIRGSASIHKTLTKKDANKLLKKLNERIDAMLNECDAVDESESGSGSYVKMQKELCKTEVLKAKVEAALTELEEDEKKSINLTDPDCVSFKSRQGSHAGYNAQIVVDDANGLIVSSDVVSESNDLRQFFDQIEQANEVLGRDCETACADAGYANTSELKKIDEKGISVVVPTARQASKKEPCEFDKSEFRYDKDRDVYVCPEEKELKFKGVRRDRGDQRVYRSKSSTCESCKNFGVCTTSKTGREIWRQADESVKQRLEKEYASEAGQAVYERRKERVEHQFGHLKRNLGVGAFLLRGIDGVRAEMSLFATCFNIRRLITLIGVDGFAALMV